MEYKVTWTIQLDADDPRQAAVLAKQIMMDPDSIATVFDVTNEETSEKTEIDLVE